MKALLFLVAAVASATPIPVTGAGSFSLDNFFDTYANVCLSGQGIELCANGIGIGPAPPEYLAGNSLKNPYMAQSTATVDGIGGPFVMSLGGYGPQFIKVMDTQGNTLASQEISGVIEITSYQEFGSRLRPDGYINTNWWARGTFTIGATPVPEPSTGMTAAVFIFCFIGVWTLDAWRNVK